MLHYYVLRLFWCRVYYLLLSTSRFFNTQNKQLNMKKTIIIIFAIVVGFIFLFVSFAANCQVWTPNPKYVAAPRDTTRKAQEKKYQCWGTTVKGERCKRKVIADHSFCYQHAGQVK